MSIIASGFRRSLRSTLLQRINQYAAAAVNTVPYYGTTRQWVLPCMPTTLSSVRDGAQQPTCFSTRLLSNAQQAEIALEPLAYQLEIVTGDVRGAGTPSPALVRLCGTRGKSEPLLVGDDEENAGFKRGTTKSYTVTLQEDIGDLQRVIVEQATTGVTELGTGWFLDRIDVKTADGELTSFPCGQWIGKSDSGTDDGAPQRNLIPCCFVHRPKDKFSYPAGEPLSVSAGGITIPHPEKVQKGAKGMNKVSFGAGGEDSYFYCKGKRNVYGLGVADGIYMWKTQGIDSGAFSRQLMRDAMEQIQGGADDVLAVLEECECRIRASGTQGSSTVCIVLIDMNQGRLMSANLGDSGFAVLGTTPSQRRLHVKYRSAQQEHEFGRPFQLGHFEGADTAQDAELMTLPVVAGDYVVLGSDGLFDNLTDEELAAVVSGVIVQGHATPAATARQLLAAAYECSLDKNKSTPYSMAATEVFDMVYSGGKKDDITVVVAQLAQAQQT